MKLKFLLHGLHPSSPQFPAHTTPYVLYEEATTEDQKEHYGVEIQNNKNQVAFAGPTISHSMWQVYRLKKL